MRSSSHSHLGLFFVLLLVLASGLGLSTSLRGAVQAAGPRVWLSQKVGPPTASVQVNGKGFGLNETVLVDFDDTTQIGSSIIDATGRFVVRVKVPKTAFPGTHTMRATGQSSGLTALATFLVQTDWAQFRFGPFQTGYNPFENVLTSSNVSALTLDWIHVTGSVINPYPAVANGIVYVGSHDHKLCTLHALDAVTGTLKWSYSTGIFDCSPPAVAGGVVYVGSDKLYTLDAMTGALKWSYSTSGGVFYSPAVANGVVYAGSGSSVGGTLYALDALTGALKWSYSTSGGIYSPAVVNGVVYVSSYTPYISPNAKLYALDAVTGTLKWSYTLGSDIGSPTVAGGVVYVSSENLYALDAVTGTLKWTYTTGSYIYPSPAVAGGLVYVGSGYPDNKLYALDALTGTLKLSYPTGAQLISPVVANGMVYAANTVAALYAFHLPGMS